MVRDGETKHCAEQVSDGSAALAGAGVSDAALRRSFSASPLPTSASCTVCSSFDTVAVTVAPPLPAGAPLPSLLDSTLLPGCPQFQALTQGCISRSGIDWPGAATHIRASAEVDSSASAAPTARSTPSSPLSTLLPGAQLNSLGGDTSVGGVSVGGCSGSLSSWPLRARLGQGALILLWVRLRLRRRNLAASVNLVDACGEALQDCKHHAVSHG